MSVREKAKKTTNRKLTASSRNNPSGVLIKDTRSYYFQSFYRFRTLQHTISSCAQTLYAMKILRAHGTIDTVLQQVYKYVILSKLQYASCAWWGFTKASDRQRINNFIRRSVKSGFCPAGLQSFGGLCETAEEKLFNQVLYNPLHVLHQLLPRQSTASQNYNLRPRNMIKNYQKNNSSD